MIHQIPIEKVNFLPQLQHKESRGYASRYGNVQYLYNPELPLYYTHRSKPSCESIDFFEYKHQYYAICNNAHVLEYESPQHLAKYKLYYIHSLRGIRKAIASTPMPWPDDESRYPPLTYSQSHGAATGKRIIYPLGNEVALTEFIKDLTDTMRSSYGVYHFKRPVLATYNTNNIIRLTHDTIHTNRQSNILT